MKKRILSYLCVQFVLTSHPEYSDGNAFLIVFVNLKTKSSSKWDRNFKVCAKNALCKGLLRLEPKQNKIGFPYKEVRLSIHLF